MQHSFASPYYPLLIGGDYQAIVDSCMDVTLVERSSDDVPWIIGALTFLGRSSEAEGIFKAYRSRLDLTLKIASQFFLGVALCREGQFSASRKILLSNARDARQSQDLTARFFHYQGMAFYRYSTGHLEKAAIWVDAALRAASGASFAYGSVLAFELLGHVQLSGGQFHSGFRNLDFAKDKATQLGQGALLQAIEISVVLYRASFGIAGESLTLLEMLHAFIGNEHFQDSYTQAALNLELARIHILRGELCRAKEQLEISSALVYKINNPDLEMDYHLQLAHLLRSRGELHQALSIVRGAKHRVEAGHDLRSRVKVLGFEFQLLKALGRYPEQEGLLPELTRISQRCGTVMAKRYLQRHHIDPSLEVRPGEDLLGDLIDRAVRYKEGVTTDILQRGWFGLLLGPLNILPSENVLYFDAEPGSLTIFNKGDVHHLSDGCSTLIRKLIILLSQRPCSKETLAIQLWQQSYNPLRHDGLIYPLVAKARKFLGAVGDWIEVYEFGYRLREGIRVTSAQLSSFEPEEQTAERRDLAPTVGLEGSNARPPSLNARQTIILACMKRGERVAPGALVKKLSVSDATITRDLASLLEMGLAIRSGRGRATHYFLATQTNPGEPS